MGGGCSEQKNEEQTFLFAYLKLFVVDFCLFIYLFFAGEQEVEEEEEFRSSHQMMSDKKASEMKQLVNEQWKEPHV